MSKTAGMFVDHTFEEPDPRHDGRIPREGEIGFVFHIEWKPNERIDYPQYLGLFEVVKIVKPYIYMRRYGEESDSSLVDFHLKLFRQRNYVMVLTKNFVLPDIPIMSALAAEMLPGISGRVKDLDIDLTAGIRRLNGEKENDLL